MPPEAEVKKESPPSKPSSKKKLVLLIVLVLLLAGGGAGAYFKFVAQPKESESTVKETEPIIKEMDTFIVNLMDPGGKRFLKVTMKTKLNNKQCMDEFGKRNFEMRDIVLNILASKEVEDIAKPEDRQTLKNELAGAMNRVLRKGQVDDIYFTDFLIQ